MQSWYNKINTAMHGPWTPPQPFLPTVHSYTSQSPSYIEKTLKNVSHLLMNFLTILLLLCPLLQPRQLNHCPSNILEHSHLRAFAQTVFYLEIFMAPCLIPLRSLFHTLAHQGPHQPSTHYLWVTRYWNTAILKCLWIVQGCFGASGRAEELQQSLYGSQSLK